MPRPSAHPAWVRAAVVLALTGAGIASASAQVPDTYVPPPLPAPQAVAYPGVIALDVDATDLAHKVMRVRQTLAVRPGPLVLLYPRWVPGTHGPYGNPSDIAGLQVRAEGRRLAWQRDPVRPEAFRVEVPAGVTSLTVEFQYLSPTTEDHGRVQMAPQMASVQWNDVLLYPAGHAARQITVAPRLKLPAGWQLGSALRAPDGADTEGWWRFDPVPLDTLVDSPVFAGRHYRRVALEPAGSTRPVTLHLVADSREQLEATPAQWEAHRRMVQQADRLFGARHFRHYDFLFSLSETMGDIGLEHHESSENGVKPTYFKDWDKAVRDRELLPHEYVHSWNGKFRRPADLMTPDFNTVPMRNSLLWVYEGQTQYWGRVLAARSGLIGAAQARGQWAQAAAWIAQRPGRAWRSLQDTTNEATFGAQGQGKAWRSWQRSADYYDEGALIWLEADALIRERTGDRRSLDDFARSFFGGHDGRVEPLPYTFDEVVAALNAVTPHDWARFLRERLDGVPGDPLQALQRSGWRLAWSETQDESAKADDEERKQSDFSHSVGLRIGTDDEATLKEVVWDGPAFQAGLAPGMRLVAVNGQAYKPERLAAAITAARDGTPLELLVREGESYRTVRVDWRGGLRYPVLERVPGTPDRMGAILQPR